MKLIGQNKKSDWINSEEVEFYDTSLNKWVEDQSSENNERVSTDKISGYYKFAIVSVKDELFFVRCKI